VRPFIATCATRRPSSNLASILTFPDFTNTSP
jgi:hypothetical protein